MAMSGMLFAPHLHQYKEVLSRQGVSSQNIYTGFEKRPFFLIFISQQKEKMDKEKENVLKMAKENDAKFYSALVHGHSGDFKRVCRHRR